LQRPDDYECLCVDCHDAETRGCGVSVEPDGMSMDDGDDLQGQELHKEAMDQAEYYYRKLAETQAKLATATDCLVRIRDDKVLLIVCRELARETLKEIGHE
jgi:hypothetical protein